MASDNDFSAIVQLMDTKKLYEESEEKWRLRLADKDEEITRLGAQLNDKNRTVEGRSQAITEMEEEIQHLKTENDRIQKEALQKIALLNERIKELNQRVMGEPSTGKVAQQGFFKK